MSCLILGCGDNDPEADELAYIVNAVSDTVSVVDTARAMVVATIPVSDNPVRAAAQQDGRRVYIAHRDGESVSIIDTDTQRVVESIALPGFASAIVTLSSGRVYVAHSVHTVPTYYDAVSVITPLASLVELSVPICSCPEGMGMLPTGENVYVACRCSSDVAVIDTATDTLISTISLGSGPDGSGPLSIAASPDGTRLYVANRFSNDVSVIDTGNNHVIATVAVGVNPTGVVTSPDGKLVYVANLYSNDINVFDAATLETLATIPIGASLAGMGIVEDGSRLVVAAAREDRVVIVNTALRVPVASVPVGDNPLAYGQFIARVSHGARP